MKRRQDTHGNDDSNADDDGDNHLINSKSNPDEDEDEGGNSNRNNDNNNNNNNNNAIQLLDFDDDVEDEEMSLFAQDFSNLPLHPDHELRPLWVLPNRHVFLENHSALSSHAMEMLNAFAVPKSRPFFMSEFVIKASSLHSAVAVGITTDSIIKSLSDYSKSVLPPSIEAFIRQATASYGKAKIVLKKNKYFIETSSNAILKELRSIPQVVAARCSSSDAVHEELMVKPTTKLNFNAPAATVAAVDGKTNEEAEEGQAQREEQHEGTKMYSFEIEKLQVASVKKACSAQGLPLLEEYCYAQDSNTPVLPLVRKASTLLRDYQNDALCKMFGNGDGRVRSGMIVLPCGAGKTLVGITACCTVAKSTLVVCNSSMAVNQWVEEFHRHAEVGRNTKNYHINDIVAKFTSNAKGCFASDAGVLVTTYHMMGAIGGDGTRKKSASAPIIDFIAKTEWGLLILDEVHVAPAATFQRVLHMAHAHCRLGLTATLVREDEKIDDLDTLVGRKLYEASWQELVRLGHIAHVKCIEVWCPMSAEFFGEYLEHKHSAHAHERRLASTLAVMNPFKFQAVQVLLHHHQTRGDKIIVFSDQIWALNHYALQLDLPVIDGDTNLEDRTKYFNQFMNAAPRTKHTVLLMSRVGDVALNIPDASVIIQICSHGSSRRQEAQRMGRILRPKKRVEDGGFNAFFYTLVSQDTNEMYYSSKRQLFLVDQGYAYDVLVGIHESFDGARPAIPLQYTTREERRDLLALVLTSSSFVGSAVAANAVAAQRHDGAQLQPKSGKRSLASLTGGADDVVYMPLNTANTAKKKKKNDNNNNNNNM